MTTDEGDAVETLGHVGHLGRTIHRVVAVTQREAGLLQLAERCRVG